MNRDIALSCLPICPSCLYPVSHLLDGTCFICRLSVNLDKPITINPDPNSAYEPLPEMTCDELDRACVEAINAIKDEEQLHDERIAMQAIDDGKTTDQRAIEALSRPERFNGEHQVASAWLSHHARKIVTER